MKTLQIFLRTLPWLVILGLIGWISLTGSDEGAKKMNTVEEQTVILKEVEKIGKLELVRYNFKEITELTELSEEFLEIFKLGPDSKIALVSVGEAVGCLDLTTLELEDISFSEDTVYLHLPEPEMCYYKLDMEKTHIYSIQTNPLKDEGEFIQRAYRQAERDIKEAALASGILTQTANNARVILKPMLEKISDRTVIFKEKPGHIRVIPD